MFKRKTIAAIVDGCVLLFIWIVSITLFADAYDGTAIFISFLSCVFVYGYYFLASGVFKRTLGHALTGLKISYELREYSLWQSVFLRNLFPLIADALMLLAALSIWMVGVPTTVFGFVIFSGLCCRMVFFLVYLVSKGSVAIEERLSDTTFERSQPSDQPTIKAIRESFEMSYLKTFSMREMWSVLMTVTIMLAVSIPASYLFLSFGMPWLLFLVLYLTAFILLILNHRYFRIEHRRANNFVGRVIHTLAICILTMVLCNGLLWFLDVPTLEMRDTDIGTLAFASFLMVEGFISFINGVSKAFRWLT